MDLLTLYGFFAVSLMLVFYALEDRSPWFILAFAFSCLMASSYGFLQGAWPFGLVEGIWSLIAVRKWLQKNRPTNGDSATLAGDANICQPFDSARDSLMTASQTNTFSRDA